MGTVCLKKLRISSSGNIQVQAGWRSEQLGLVKVIPACVRSTGTR